MGQVQATQSLQDLALARESSEALRVEVTALHGQLQAVRAQSEAQSTAQHVVPRSVSVMPSEAGRARKVFYGLDADGDGVISKGELVALHNTGPATFADLRADGNGEVSVEEWLRFLGALESRSGGNTVRFLLHRLEADLAPPSDKQVDDSTLVAENEALRQRVVSLEGRLQHDTESASMRVQQDAFREAEVAPR